MLFFLVKVLPLGCRDGPACQQFPHFAFGHGATEIKALDFGAAYASGEISGSGGRAQFVFLPFPRQQFMKPVLRDACGAGEHVSQPG